MRRKPIELGYHGAPVSGRAEPKAVLPLRRVRVVSEMQLRLIALVIWMLIALLAFVLVHDHMIRV